MQVLNRINSLFAIKERLSKGNSVRANLRLNPSHIIYKGHFPGYPVTPGVVQLQIILVLVENHLQEKLRLDSITQCKFTHVLNPLVFAEIELDIQIEKIEQNLFAVAATGKALNFTFMKLQAKFCRL
jgi:3-hydroxyacyl-[acyl-carrier-protein] dehydratase